MKMKMIDKFDGEFAFLSNFYESPVSDGFTTFPTVEHYFQAAKAVWVKDYDDIQHAKTPGQAKRIGRKIAIRGDWESIKLDVMETALRKKFAIPELREKLLATGDAWLEEGNHWHDNFWGVCHCVDCQDEMGWNDLGKILMKIRDEIRESL
jgi:ribA/ribD-fused uncharacterized protein